jgi:hypothetical protein
MTRYTKNSHGHYLIHGHKYEMLEGSRAQVLHGTAYKTSGGLKKHEIMMNKNGRIVSRKKHMTAKKEKRLVKAGYGTKKGKFGYVKLGKSKKMRGGQSMTNLAQLNPAPVTGGSRRRRRGGQSTMMNHNATMDPMGAKSPGRLVGMPSFPVNKPITK